MLLAGFFVQPFISGVTEVLQNLCLITWFDSIPFHGLGMKARRARPSSFLFLETEKKHKELT